MAILRQARRHGHIVPVAHSVRLLRDFVEKGCPACPIMIMIGVIAWTRGSLVVVVVVIVIVIVIVIIVVRLTIAIGMTSMGVHFHGPHGLGTFLGCHVPS
jgi:hypothetical protein